MRATLFAWRHLIPSVKQVGVWNGYRVFQPANAAKEPKRIPRIILQDASGTRFATADEVFSCLNGLIP